MATQSIARDRRQRVVVAGDSRGVRPAQRCALAPLFGYDLAQFEELFDEKLDLFVNLLAIIGGDS